MATTTAYQSGEKKLIEKEKARSHMRELRLKRKKYSKLKKKENESLECKKCKLNGS